MNNLVKIRKKILKENRLHQARILAMKNGKVSKYSSNVFQNRLKQIQKEFDLLDS